MKILGHLYLLHTE